MTLRGVFPAIVTPFLPRGAGVDVAWIPGHVEYLRRGGVDGLLALGTTGEGPSLSMAERWAIIDTIMACAQGLTVLVGTGCPALPDTIDISRYAWEKGASALLVVPPYYYKSPPGLYQYYHALLQALPSEAQVLLYNIPSHSGVEIEDKLIDALRVAHPLQLAGVKDTSGQIEKTRHYIQRHPSLATFVGSDELASAALCSGAVGVISALANLFPGLVAAVYRAHQSGGNTAAAQERLSRARAILAPYPLYSALKWGLVWQAGLPLSHVRPPLSSLTPQQVESLEQEIRALAEEASP
ncbi:MAG: dihydrodipicolinate synthase family protein [Chloroflexi bacterium]|nr:dihydrodipicolinate synthase family protein [Chloroflexota bacterium]